MIDSNLPIFISVADLGSFSRAGCQFKKSPQTIFRQISSFENKIGIKLFDRSPAGMKLTQAGRSFYKDARFLQSFAKEAVKRAKKIEKNSENLIRVAFSPLTPVAFLKQVWPVVMKQYPNLRVELVPFENEKVVEADIISHLGNEGLVDIMLTTYDENFLIEKKCTALKLTDLSLSIAMSLNHRLANKDKLTIEDIRSGRESLLLMSRDLVKGYNSVREIFLKDNLVRKEYFDSLNMKILNRCASSGSLLLATNAWTFSHPLLKSVPLEVNETIPFGVIHSKHPTEQVRKILKIIEFVNLEQQNFKLW